MEKNGSEDEREWHDTQRTKLRATFISFVNSFSLCL